MGAIASFFKIVTKLFGGGGNNWVFVVLMLISLFTKKKKKQEPATTNTPSSQTYSWDNISSTAEVDSPLPIVFGRHKIGGNIINTLITTKIAKYQATETFAAIGAYSSGLQQTYMNVLDSSTHVVTARLACGATRQLDLTIGLDSRFREGDNGLMVSSRSSALQQVIGTVCRIYYKKITDSDWIFLDNYLAAAASKTIQVKNLSEGYTGGYDVKIEYLPLATRNQNGVVISSEYKGFGYISLISYTKTTTMVNVGSVNEMTAQTLYMDIGLSVGQIRALEGATINDQSINDYKISANNTNQRLRIEHSYKKGYDFLIEDNINSDMTKQSAVFSKNQTISRMWAVLATANASAGDTRIQVADNSLFTLGGYCYIASYPGTKIKSFTDPEGHTSNVYIELETGISGAVAAGATYVGTETPSQYTATEETKGAFNDVTYTTSFDVVDELDLGINAPNGMYWLKSDDGSYQPLKTKYQIYIGHKEVVGSNSVIGNHFYTNTFTVEGNRRGKIWFNLYIGRDILVPSSTGKKQYKLLIRKLTGDSIVSEYVNELQLAFVEEIKSKDLFYNGLSYVTLRMPADSRLSGGNPTFSFTITGNNVPQTLPLSISVDTASSTNSIIQLKNDDIVNYTENGNDWKLATLCAFGTSRAMYFDLGDFHEMLFMPNSTSINNEDLSAKVITTYHKVGIKWHKRYTLYTNKVGDYYDLDTHKGQFIILTSTNLAYLKTTVGSWTAAYKFYDKLYNYVVNNADSLGEVVQDLPGISEDVIFYTWSDNPAFCTLYLLIDEENGLKLPVQYVDVDSFKEAAAYYDEYIDNPLNKGEKIRRCRLNFVIDTVADVRQHIDKICATCHAALFESNGIIKMMVDKAEEAITLSIDEDEDIIPDTLKIVTLPDKELPNQINITYRNAANDYNKEVVTIEDTSLSRNTTGMTKVRKLDMELYGVTDEAHVYIEGLRLIKVAKYAQYTCSFRTGLSTYKYELGSVFKLSSASHGWTKEAPMLFKVMNIKYEENQEVEISAIEYFSEVYDITEDDLSSYPVVYHGKLPNANTLPDIVRNLTIYEENTQNKSGDIITNIIGTFTPPDSLEYRALNGLAYTKEQVASGASSVTVRDLSTIRSFKVGDRFNFNKTVTETDMETLENLIKLANLVPVSQTAVNNLNAKYDELTPYTISSIDYNNGVINFTPIASSTFSAESVLGIISHDIRSKYEYSKYSYAVADLVKHEDGAGLIVRTGVKSNGNMFRFDAVPIGSYSILVRAVSANEKIGAEVESNTISVQGKLTKPSSVLDVTLNASQYKNSRLIDWSPVVDADIKTYMVQIGKVADLPTMLAPDASYDPALILMKFIKDPTEYEHAFSSSGNYNIFVAAINTSGIVAESCKVTASITIDIEDDFTTPDYTVHGNILQFSWNDFVMTGVELPRYALYMKPSVPYILDEGTGKYNIQETEKAWEGTSTQISVGNLPGSAAVLSFDTPYYVVLVAKYKYKGIEVTKHAPLLSVPSLADQDAKIYLYATTPEIISGMIDGNDLKIFIAGVPESKFENIFARVYKLGTVPAPSSYKRLIKNNVTDLWESTIAMFQDLTDGDYVLEVDSDESFNKISVQFKVDTSIPAPLPQPFITKDNTYVQTQQISYSARTAMPFTGSEAVDIYNSKTIQICLPTFTTCANFSHIKMYIAEYDATVKGYGAYNEYKIPQAVGLKDGETVVNFKSIITFAEDMPDFKIKMVMVKKNGVEGSLAHTIASVRSKIDTTPPLIKINSIIYDGDSTNTNYVNNNYINAKLNTALGLLLDLSITELNSGLWSSAIDISALKMPIYYQINNGEKKPLFQKGASRFASPYLIPKADLSASDGSKVTITIFALDNAMKVGSITMTKVVDLTAPANVTSPTAIFGVEANQGVIKTKWVIPTDTDLAGIRIYENGVLIKETIGASASLPTPNGNTRNFVIKSVDYAGNESSGVALEAVNYAPKKVGTITAYPTSGSINIGFQAVTEDTNNDIMTDLKYYEVSYYNPNLGQTVTAITNTTSYLITMNLADQWYFNAYQNQYITNIKVRAVDFFGAEGAYSDAITARPRFVEAVDMTGNMFKFVPSVNGSYTLVGASSLECVVDANYKNTEYLRFDNVYQGIKLRLDMRPEYIAETKVKFVGGISSYARFIVHYVVVHPTTLIESDLYLAASGHTIDTLYEEANLATAYSNYIQVSITDNNSGTEKDKENTFIISLMKGALSRKSFFIKAVELIFVDNSQSMIGVAELQPKVRSIANDFYGETLLLSKMASIRSSESATEYLEMSSTDLTMYKSSLRHLVLGDLSVVGGTGYGLWAKDNILLGGTTAANANLKIDTSSVNIGWNAGYNIYATSIYSGSAYLNYSPHVGYMMSINSGGISLYDYYDCTKLVMISSQPYLGGIGLGYRTYANNLYYFDTIIKPDAMYMGYRGAYTLHDYSYDFRLKIDGSGGHIHMGHYTVTGSGTALARYQLEVNSTGTIKLGYYGYKSTDNTSVYNTKITATSYEVGLTDINNEYYNTKISSGRVQLGHLSSGTNYALDMDYSGAESTSMRYFSIKGSDLTDYFRIGYFQNGTYYKRAAWMRRLYVSSDYTADVANSLGANAYSYLYVTENLPGLCIVAGTGATTYPAANIITQTVTGIGITRITGSNPGIDITHDGTGNCITAVAQDGYGIYAHANNNYGGYFSSNWDFSLCSTKQSHFNGKVWCAGALDVVGTAVFRGNIAMTNIPTSGTGTSYPIYVDANGYFWKNTSSLKYKADVSKKETDYMKILEIVPYNFTWKATNTKDYGYIAEYVAEKIPDLVMFENGDPNGVRYDRIALYLLEVVKNQQKAIDKLEKLVDKLVK